MLNALAANAAHETAQALRGVRVTTASAKTEPAKQIESTTAALEPSHDPSAVRPDKKTCQIDPAPCETHRACPALIAKQTRERSCCDPASVIFRNWMRCERSPWGTTETIHS